MNQDENQYLDLIKSILSDGESRDDRTGTGTLALFGKTLNFSLENNTIPLLTTKRVFWKGVVEELLWIISGSTDSKELSKKGVRIWDGNGSREFLDKTGFPDREVGDLGSVYGHQWRHSGAKYKDCYTDYTGQGVDQLSECISLIKTDPFSRRIIINCWNPSDIPNMNLPPCHMMVQFFVSSDKSELSCQMYMRSCDVGLGLPFNIASYGLLTHMVAQCCGMTAKNMTIVIGDCHIYINHVEHVEKQILREPFLFPKVNLNPQVKEIDSFNYNDIVLCDYTHHTPINMPFSA